MVCPSGATVVKPGESIQTAINAAGAGGSLCVKPGIYRLTSPLLPRTGQTLTFEPGAILNGARPVTDWVPEGAYWVSSGHTQRMSDAPWLGAHKCNDNPTACIYEDLFRDDIPLVHVIAKSDLGPGKVYFDKSTNKMYVTDDPSGHKWEATRLTIGIKAEGVDSVTIRGATIEKFGWIGARIVGNGATVQQNEIRYSHATGLLATGNGHVVRGNYLHHNGNTGLVAQYGSGLVFESNHLSHNNYLGFGMKPTAWHEGGAKVLNTSDVIVRNNYSHHNDGDGWWFDTDNIRVTVEDNVFADNSRYGFFYEVSHDALIRKNAFRGNGTDRAWKGGGMRVTSSRNVEIVSNVFDSNRHSTLFVNYVDRGSGIYGTFETTGLHVHDNVFKLEEGWIGSSWGKAEIGAAWANNRFEHNTYLVADLTRKWWIWTPNGFMDWAKWRSLGFDQHGSSLS